MNIGTIYKKGGYMKLYYFFDEYGECFAEKWFSNEDEASAYCETIEAEYFCCV